MSENNSSQTMPIRVSRLSNFLLGGLVAGCLVIGIAHLVESGKRKVIEEQLFTEVKELINWHKQRVELADSDQQLVRHIVGIKGVSKEAAEWAVGVATNEEKFKTRIASDPVVGKAVAFATIYSNGFRIEEKKPSESEEVKEELLSDQKEAMNSAESYHKEMLIKTFFPEVEEELLSDHKTKN
jgi:hypothetical protein